MSSKRVNQTNRLAESRRGVAPAAKGSALAAVLLVLWLTSAQAAEIQLYPEGRARGPVVTLGDVAKVIASDPQEVAKLSSLELFPAPPPGRQRFIRLREIQDLLMVRGIGLAEHRFSGSSQVAVQGAGETARPTDQRPLSPTALKSAERQMGDTIARYLQEQAAGNEGWIVEVSLDGATARAIAGGGGRISLRGGAAPWVGNQRFEVTVDTADQPQTFTVEARVSKPGMVVVTARSLLRGAVIRPDDVQLQRPAPGEDASNAFRAVGEVVGLETTRALGEGHLLEHEAVRAPLAVRRGEVITVYARGAGLRVRTTARTRDDGSLGDLVSVESLTDRKTFTARVCGIQEAEVFARAIQAEPMVAHVPGVGRGMGQELRRDGR